MARSFTKMGRDIMISHAALVHNVVIPVETKYRQILIQVIKMRPVFDDNDQSKWVGNHTIKYTDINHIGRDLQVDAVDSYLWSMNAYKPEKQGQISKWLTINCPQLFPDHCFSHGPDESNREYWLTVSGEKVNVQWVMFAPERDEGPTK